MNEFKRIVSFVLIIWVLQSCVSVKEYQKAYLNDSEMTLAPKKLEGYESSFQSYREGASGASGGSVGGGCGCN
jgi:hypothetical protein